MGTSTRSVSSRLLSGRVVRCHSVFEGLMNALTSQHWLCLPCRRVWRKRHGLVVPRCPGCRRLLIKVGVDFKPPRRSDRNQWRKVVLLISQGQRFMRGEPWSCQGRTRRRSISQGLRLSHWMAVGAATAPAPRASCPTSSDGHPGFAQMRRASVSRESSTPTLSPLSAGVFFRFVRLADTEKGAEGGGRDPRGDSGFDVTCSPSSSTWRHPCECPATTSSSSAWAASNGSRPPGGTGGRQEPCAMPSSMPNAEGPRRTCACR